MYTSGKNVRGNDDVCRRECRRENCVLRQRGRGFSIINNKNNFYEVDMRNAPFMIDDPDITAVGDNGARTR